jgi:DNA-binding NarL/FixJ family response regulator
MISLKSNSRGATSVVAAREQQDLSEPARVGRTEVGSASTSPVAAETKMIVVIDEHVLTRECLARCLKTCGKNHEVAAFASVAEWQESMVRHPGPSVIILGSYGHRHAQIELDLAALVQSGMGIPIVVICDDEEVEHVLCALEGGARGYIPTSVTLEVVVGAIYLVLAGGTFVPGSCVLSLKGRERQATAEKGSDNGPFTTRQSAVVEAVRQGKTNKQIAYELSMRESTVKVHVRNIMRKLKARNRTEVAFLTSKIRAQSDSLGCRIGSVGK